MPKGPDWTAVQAKLAQPIAADHIAHVCTQLPHASLAATVAALGFAVIGAAL